MNIISHRAIFFLVSGILILASVTAFAVFGLKPGIDFTGGTLWQITITQTSADLTQASAEEIRKFFEVDLGVKNITVSPADNQSFLIRLSHISEGEHQRYLEALKIRVNPRGNPRESALIEELRFDSIGPVVGKELQSKAIWAVILVLLGISLYVAFAFRKVVYPIKSWKYGIITLLTLFHDVIIPAGMLAILGHYLNVEVDIKFIVALLVVMGFSVHDTIVVFDRIRENLLIHRQRYVFSDIINQSIKQTFARSVNTSLTLVLVLLALLFFGPASLQYFILTILVGTIVGTYSSIFIASPLLFVTSRSKET